MTQTNFIQAETEHNVCASPVSSAGVKLRAGQTVIFVNRNGVVQYKARVCGRAGKATGKYKNWYNLQHLEPEGSDGQKESVDMSRVDSVDNEPENMTAVVLITKDISFDVAKQEEVKNWHCNDVFEEVKDASQK